MLAARPAIRHRATYVALAALLLCACVSLVAAKPRRLLLPTEEDGDAQTARIAPVQERKLITPKPTFRSIVNEHNRIAEETYSRRHFRGDTLGYVTPWYVPVELAAD